MTSPVLSAPDFLGIGAPRCGSTWLYKMLRLHPGVWIPWKELHYFDSVDPGRSSRFRIQDRAFRLRKWWLPLGRRLLLAGVPGARQVLERRFPLQAIHAPGFRWVGRFALGEANHGWYSDLFREGQRMGRLCGEITPAYSMLSEPMIAEIGEQLPRLRVILLLRDPLEAAWSSYKLSRPGELLDAALAESEPRAFSRPPIPGTWMDHAGNLRRWRAVFGERLLVGFYDDIVERPEELLDRICAFLGLPPIPEELRHVFGERVGTSGSRAMPAWVRAQLAEANLPTLEALSEDLGGHATRWLGDARAVLAETTSSAAE